MKILQVVHLFLPRHKGGVEVYTDLLVREQARKHEVALYHTEHQPGEEPYRLERRERDGVKIYEVINNKSYGSFEESYHNEALERRFAEVLDEFRPDVVHLQHLLFHSLGYTRIARERGIPVVFTLHEYWLICLRDGQMILPDLSRCPLPAATDCARCAALGRESASTLERVGDRVVRSMKRLTGVDLWPLLRSARIKSPYFVKRLMGWAPGKKDDRSSGPADAAHVARVEQRWKAVRAALEDVDLLIAPSPFLREMFLSFGVPEEKIVFSDYGFDTSRFGERSERKRAADAPIRFGFVGSIIPVKGVHVAVEAFRGIDPARAELVVHGSSGHRPDYHQELVSSAAGHPIRFAGEFDNRRIAEILGELDVLIVPSVWYENSPLTIHEGFLAGIPVMTSDLGGMKDLVQEGRNGFLFQPGDAADLRRRVEEILERPEILDEIRSKETRVKTIAENATELEEIYDRLVPVGGGGAS